MFIYLHADPAERVLLTNRLKDFKADHGGEVTYLGAGTLRLKVTTRKQIDAAIDAFSRYTTQITG